MDDPTAQRMLDQAVAAGVDLSMLRERLRLTPTERLERHAQALATLDALRQAGATHRAQPRRLDSGSDR